MIERQFQEDKKEYALDIKRAEDQLIQARAEVAKQSALAEERTALVETSRRATRSSRRRQPSKNRNQLSRRRRADAHCHEQLGTCSGSLPGGYRADCQPDQAQDTLSQVQARLNATQERVAQLRARLSNAQTPRSAFSCANARCKRWKRKSRRRRPVSAWSRLRLQ